MNDNERAALVEELAEAMYNAGGENRPRDFRNDFGQIEYEVREYRDRPEWLRKGRERLAAACLPIIERMLAAAAAPTVDDDAVERAARALWSVDDGERSVHDPTWDKAVEIGASAVDLYREMARAALTAAPGAGFDLDSELKAIGVEPYIQTNAGVQCGVVTVGGPFVARLYVNGRAVNGEGKTFTAAIQTAVAKARKGAGQ